MTDPTDPTDPTDGMVALLGARDTLLVTLGRHDTEDIYADDMLFDAQVLADTRKVMRAVAEVRQLGHGWTEIANLLGDAVMDALMPYAAPL